MEYHSKNFTEEQDEYLLYLISKNNKKVKNIHEIANSFGMDEVTVRNRIHLLRKKHHSLGNMTKKEQEYIFNNPLKSRKELAEELGISEHTITVWRKKFGQLRNRKVWTPEVDKKAREMAKNGMSQPQIAKALGFTISSVSSYFHDKKIRTIRSSNSRDALRKSINNFWKIKKAEHVYK